MQESSNKILVVDDDHRLRDLLERYLQEQGFEVRVVADGKAMDKALSREFFRLIVLDLMLPGEDGLSICRRLRGQANDIPVLMLTAKGDEVDRIVGLEIGADDYLPKPFNPRELVARINAILRRHNSTPAGAPEEEHAQIQIGQYILDLGTRMLSCGEKKVSLTTGQYALLKALATQPHKPLSRDSLMAQLNERDYESFDRSIDVQISRLRKIVEEDPKSPRYIQTVWGHGYVFVPDGENPA
jgi:two-component system phosphate regulon response regulator OmpR